MSHGELRPILVDFSKHIGNRGCFAASMGADIGTLFDPMILPLAQVPPSPAAAAAAAASLPLFASTRSHGWS